MHSQYKQKGAHAWAFSRVHTKVLAFLFLGVFSLLTTSMVAQISGTIADEDGEMLIGASVIIKGTSTGTVTDVDGNFTLQDANVGDMLTVSYTGFSSKDMVASSNMQIVLEQGATLDEVVVTGVFDARTRMDASVSISTISTEQIDRVAATSAADLLKNIPGVYVNQARGEIWNSVYSRGLSANSIDNINGYRYVSLQEDGLPVTNLELFPDQFLRPDAMTERVEAVRGGTASILGANAPGGIFNYVTKTGGSEFGGEVRGKFGLEGNGQNPYYRADFQIGGPLAEGLTYSLGGFYRQSEGARDRGYPINDGGQLRGNLLKTYKTGSLKLNLKYLNDRNDRMAFIPSQNWDDPQVAEGFSRYDSYALYDFEIEIPFNQDDRRTFRSRDLIHNRDNAATLNWVQDLGSGFTLKNDMRVSRKIDERNATAVVTPIAVTDFLFYAIPSLLGRTGVYTFSDPRDGTVFGTVTQAFDPTVQGGPPFTFTAGEDNNFPGSNVQANSLLFMPMFYTENIRNEFTNQLTLNKKTKNMSFNLGGFFSRTNLEVTNYNKGMGLSGGLIQDQPVPAKITLEADPDRDGTTEIYEVTSPEGFMNVGWSGSDNSETTQGITALFFGHNWNINDQLTLDYGLRYENVISNGFNSIAIENPMQGDETFGGRDGNPLTIWDNGGGVMGPELNYDYTLNSFSFSAGLNYKFNANNALYGRFSRGNKAPSTFFYLDLNSQALIDNTPALLEEITQIEIGYKVKTDHLRMTVTPFYSLLNNVPNIQTFEGGMGNYTPPIQFAKYTTYGVELEGTYRINKEWSVRANAVVQNATADVFTSWLERGPVMADDELVDFSGNETENNPNLMFNISPAYNTDKFFASVNYSYMGTREANVSNAFELPAFATVDLSFGYDISKSFSLQANINNVFDKYGILGWQGPGGFPQALDRQGFTPEFVQNNPNSIFTTQGSMPRAYFLTGTYRF